VDDIWLIVSNFLSHTVEVKLISDYVWGTDKLNRINSVLIFKQFIPVVFQIRCTLNNIISNTTNTIVKVWDLITYLNVKFLPTILKYVWPDDGLVLVGCLLVLVVLLTVLLKCPFNSILICELLIFWNSVSETLVVCTVTYVDILLQTGACVQEPLQTNLQ
jgi:hypothetical protein